MEAQRYKVTFPRLDGHGVHLGLKYLQEQGLGRMGEKRLGAIYLLVNYCSCLKDTQVWAEPLVKTIS